MRRILLTMTAIAVVAASAAPADAGRKPSGKGPSGVEGTVSNTTCPGPCVQPAPPAPAYSGDGLTVRVRRAGDGALVASAAPSDGRFRIKVKRGLYDVSATVTQPTPIQPAPASMQSCWQGDSQRVQVRRHRFAHVELHVQNVCIL